MPAGFRRNVPPMRNEADPGTPDRTLRLDVLEPTPWSSLEGLEAGRRRALEAVRSGFYLQTGLRCDQACRYCFQEHPPVATPVEDLQRAAALARRLGLQHPKLIGGEPLRHPALGQVIGRLRDEGFARFDLYTNGGRLADEGVVERLAARGLRQCYVSFDSPREAVQDDLARRPGLFRRLERALQRLAAFPDVVVTLGAVVVAPNVDHLDELVAWVARARQRWGLEAALFLHQFKPYGGADPSLHVSFGRQADAVAAALEASEREGVAAFCHHMPFCRLPRPERYAVDHHVRLVTVDEAGARGLLEDAATRKAARCEACRHARTCPGFLSVYADRFGDAEFQPVPGEES
jgi:hypothetical protein